MLQINKKLKEARELVGYTQKQLAEWMQVTSHSLISQYENGKKSGVSEAYIDFLLAHNFDLNSVFDNAKTLKRFTPADLEILLTKEPVLNIAVEPGSMLDKYLTNLQNENEHLRGENTRLIQVIENLQDEQKDNRLNTDGRAKSA